MRARADGIYFKNRISNQEFEYAERPYRKRQLSQTKISCCGRSAGDHFGNCETIAAFAAAGSAESIGTENGSAPLLCHANEAAGKSSSEP
jgi:hypothetical protein